MPDLVTCDLGQAWIEQFEYEDQYFATGLLREFIYIDDREFATELTNLVKQEAKKTKGKIALYVEREVERDEKIFKETAEAPVRAIGDAPIPMGTKDKSVQDVGSEGRIATLIKEICRDDKHKFLNHPAPDMIRKEKVSDIFIVTDLLASGRQIQKFINAFWKVWSVKSWHSYHLVRFSVISYASTSKGEKLVATHPSKPHVSYVRACPTVKDLEHEQLCIKYNPSKINDLGFGDVGALMAFDHGCPNNAPPIFHFAKAGKWIALFPFRSSSAAREQKIEFDFKNKLLESLDFNFNDNPQQEPLFDSATQIQLIALLNACRKRPNGAHKISSVTGIALPVIHVGLVKLKENGWINSKLRLTSEGHKLLKSIQKKSPKNQLVDQPAIIDYCPTQLRVPH